ncbi:MAG: NUDIX domain-containing protein [Candidatus Acidiferrales bacterium]|jgi:8-oxo-dGTP pyrophosphatase MutT (NUDIX family)
MPASPYVHDLRAKIGNGLLMLSSVTAMLFDEQRRLLVVRDANTGKWITLGGAVDPDESPSDAIVRECWEELGIVIEPTRLMGVFGGPTFRVNYVNGDTVSYVVCMFEVRKVSGDPKPDNLEISDVKYVTREEMAKLSMSDATREMFEHAFEFNGKPYFSQVIWQPPSNLPKSG